MIIKVVLAALACGTCVFAGEYATTLFDEQSPQPYGPVYEEAPSRYGPEPKPYAPAYGRPDRYEDSTGSSFGYRSAPSTYEEPTSYGPAAFKRPEPRRYGPENASDRSRFGRVGFGYSARSGVSPKPGYGPSYASPAPYIDEESLAEVQKLTVDAETAIVKANKIIERLGERESVKDLIERIRRNTAHNQYEIAHIVYENYKKAVGFLDRDADGLLSRADLKIQHDQTLPYWNRYIKHFNNRGAVDLYNYVHLDANGDGLVTRDEFVQSVAGGFNGEIWEFCWVVGFSLFDTKPKDGYLNAAELVDLSETHIELILNFH